MEQNKSGQSGLKLPKEPRVRLKPAIDFSQCLSAELYDKVAGIIPIAPRQDTNFEEVKVLSFVELLKQLDPKLLKKLKKDEITESNFAEVVEKHRNYNSVDLNIEERLPPRTSDHKANNWISDYSKKLKKERIVWQTKLFRDKKTIQDKPIFEQTEELIDIAAVSFANWLNDMDEESNIQPSFVKQLFSIQIEGDASKALYVDPKEINVVPHEVAKMLSLKDYSMQNELTKIKQTDKRYQKRTAKKVSTFGRTLPKELRKPKYNEELFDELYKINCPLDLRSLKCVFDGILHLRSTKALVAHLKENPALPRAKFLIDNKMFESRDVTKSSNQTPLWEHFYAVD